MSSFFLSPDVEYKHIQYFQNPFISSSLHQMIYTAGNSPTVKRILQENFFNKYEIDKKDGNFPSNKEINATRTSKESVGKQTNPPTHRCLVKGNTENSNNTDIEMCVCVAKFLDFPHATCLLRSSTKNFIARGVPRFHF